MPRGAQAAFGVNYINACVNLIKAALQHWRALAQATGCFVDLNQLFLRGKYAAMAKEGETRMPKRR
jgi:hypothetical protein